MMYYMRLARATITGGVTAFLLLDCQLHPARYPVLRNSPALLCTLAVLFIYALVDSLDLLYEGRKPSER